MIGFVTPFHMECCSENLRPCSESLSMQFRQLNYSLPAKGGKLKEVLHDVSGQILSGRLTAILGPSGAGKTSLLNVLAGFKIRGVKGSVLVNGEERVTSEFRTQACYITQDTGMLGNLTAIETLSVAAKLKLTTSAEERSSVVAYILDLLALTKSRDTYVRDLSGGEKKRLSIGLELITNPPIMFFDEPTSGLDSVSSAQIMIHLRSLASSGHAVACVIHQPSSRLCDMFDDVILLAEGRVLYCGPTNQIVPVFEEAGFACPQYYNRADFALEVACGERGPDLHNLLDRYRSPIQVFQVSNEDLTNLDPKHQLNSDSTDATLSILPSNNMCNNNEFDKYNRSVSKYPVSQTTQFWILLHRIFVCTYRDVYMAQIRLFSHVLIGVLISLVFYDIGNDGAKINSNAACLFFFVMFLFFSNAMPTIMTFPSEMSVFLREHLNNWYSLPSYFFAKCIANFPLQILCPTLFLLVSYWMTGQPLESPRFAMSFLACVLLVILAQTMSMMIGAAFGAEMGIFLVPVTTIPMLLFSGFFQRLQDIPFYLQWLGHISYFRNTFEALTTAVYGNNRAKLNCSEPFCYFRQGDKFIEHLGMREENYWCDIVSLVAWTVISHILLFIVLKWRIHTSR